MPRVNSERNRSRRFVSIRRAIGLTVESLERRMLLTSTLYVDFGDRFPVGGLTGTVGTLKTATSGVAGDPAVAGPDMDEDTNGDFNSANTEDADAFTMTSFNNRYTTDGGNYTGGVAQLRADIMSFVQRFYQPFDIDVIELTATAVNVNGRMVSGADSLADISSTLGANEAGVAKNNDGYVLLGQTIVHRPAGTGGDIDISSIWGGYASVIDMPNGNNSDNTAIGFVAPGALGPGVNPGGWGNLIAHEAGHLFGFQHCLTQAPSGAVSPLIPTSEIMSYLGGNGFNFFSRYPMVQGNANTSNNEDLMAASPPAPAGNRTPYDQWINTASIGQNTDFHYITGTGAHDIITITKSGGNANVSVQAFSDANHTTALNVPGSGGASTTYSYTLALDRPFVLDGGDRDDQFVLDGDLGITLTVRGMSGNDDLVVMGKNAPSATYTTGTNSANGLDGLSDLRGSVVIGSTTINLQEFEDPASQVTIQDVAALTYRTGGSDDDITLETGQPGIMTLDGDSDGVNLVTVLFTNVGTLTIDTATNDGGVNTDNVMLDANAVATGLNVVNVNTGAGDDVVRVSFTGGNPIPAGGLNFDGGTGTNDILRIVGGSFTNEVHNATGSNSGNITFDGTTVINYTNLSPVEDIAGAVNFTFNAMPGSDVINIVDGTLVNSTDTTEINSGNGTFEKYSFGNKTNATINGLSGDDAFTLSGLYDDTPGLTTLTLNGNAGDDDFTLSASALIPITINGGADTTDGDTIFLDGLALDTTLAATTLTTAGRQPITYGTIETLALSNGTFNLLAPVVISPNVHVNASATLYGDGTILGRLTGNVAGTVAPGTTLGNSTAILNAGGLTLNAGSTYFVDLNGLTNGTEHDMLNVTGTVALNNGDLAGAVNFVSIPGDELMIIRNDGADPVVGKFAQGDIIEIGGKKFAVDYAYNGDNDGNFNDVALIRYGAELAPDPCDPDQLALFVGATTGNDNIRITKATGNRRLNVEIEAVTQGFTDFFGPFDYRGLSIVFGQSGDDYITTEDVPSREVWVFGQAGDDELRTGNNSGLLLGGWGEDTAIGGNQQDILVGGRDADLLDGGSANDVLIGGYIDFENNTPANRDKLCDISDEWFGGGGWKSKIDHLTNGGGANGTTVLDATTVFDDNAIDNLIGNTGKDWFLARTAGLNADILDADSNELVQEI